MNLKKFKETKTVVLPCLSLFKPKEKKLKKKKTTQQHLYLDFCLTLLILRESLNNIDYYHLLQVFIEAQHS